MSFLGSLSGQLLMSVVCGLLVAATPLGLREIALIVWILCLVAGWRQRDSHGNGSRISSSVLAGLSVLVMGGICVAAYYAPFKTKDEVLNRRIELPKTDYTLAELREPFDFDLPPLPFRAYFNFPDADANRIIRFSQRGLTIRQFIDAIETQSSLRHQFHSCGNGHTILTGEDCCFGLSFSTGRQMPGAVVKVE
ncbi:MAG TPA: hypothetical protein VMP01_02765 [Pirellulaceae bacterium]|nr:hypothetical protein [Pirellulaceae bacterium]